MELTGQQRMDAPRQKVWDALNDPVILSRCVPGCEEITKVSESEMQARVLLKIGPVRARFSGRMFMSELRAPASCILNFEGAGGAAGFAKGRSQVSLADDGGGTRLSYTVEASVGGKLGQIGGRLIDSSAKKMADEFFTAFNAALSDPDLGVPRFAPEAGQPPSAGVPAAHTADTAHTAHTARQAPDGGARPFAGAFLPELYRAFWFSFGAAFALLISRWIA